MSLKGMSYGENESAFKPITAKLNCAGV